MGKYMCYKVHNTFQFGYIQWHFPVFDKIKVCYRLESLQPKVKNYKYSV